MDNNITFGLKDGVHEFILILTYVLLQPGVVQAAKDAPEC